MPITKLETLAPMEPTVERMDWELFITMLSVSFRETF